MQSAHEVATPAIPGGRQVNGSESARTLVLRGRHSTPLTDTSLASDLRDRIEVWVNEGGAGGEAY
jgi:hypothetical protein